MKVSATLKHFDPNKINRLNIVCLYEVSGGVFERLGNGIQRRLEELERETECIVWGKYEANKWRGCSEKREKNDVSHGKVTGAGGKRQGKGQVTLSD